MTRTLHVRVSDIAELETKLWDMREELRGVLIEAELLVDALEEGSSAVIEAKDKTWDACQEARKHLREIAGSLRGERQGFDAVTRLVRAANDFIQADNACILGRSGCEKRWDDAMKELKAAVGVFRE